MMQTYWLLSVVERAKSVDPEKVISVWEGGHLPGCDRESSENAGL